MVISALPQAAQQVPGISQCSCTCASWCPAPQTQAGGGPPGAIILMMSICVRICVCVSSEEAPGCCPITPSMKWHPLDPQLFTVYRKFWLTQGFISFNPPNYPKQQDKLGYAHFMGKDNLLGRGWLAQDAISGRAGLIPVHYFSTIPCVFSH